MGMSKPATFEKLSDILIELLGVEPAEIDGDSRIIEDLGADSLDVAESSWPSNASGT
jgi:acyl carrier protein